MPKFTRVSPQEQASMLRMNRRGRGVRKIAKVFGRSRDTVSKKVFPRHGAECAPKLGYPKNISPKKRKRIECKIYSLVTKASAMREVTAKRIHKELNRTCSAKTLLRAIWQHNLAFRPLYDKPDITEEDKGKRLGFGEEHKHFTSLPRIWSSGELNYIVVLNYSLTY